MSQPFLISASILSADFAHLGEQITALEEAGADRVHVDVMDGHFVPNITMGPFIVETCRRITSLNLDVHLMIEKPERYLEAFAKAGASLLSVHVETCPHLYRTLQEIHQLGCQSGVVLNPGTPAAAIQEVIPLVDLVLVMTVNPGFSGQVFLPQMMVKIAQVRRMLDEVNPKALLEVDGGINVATLPQAYQAGARVFITAQAIFKHPKGIQAGIDELRACLLLGKS
ncbi:MAG: ribulose-phosphate 3-epimerase [Anaerolineales bacterium]|nr:ribulose-phosphate 3-epimerase [Anaerolineales bacterium]